jgi:hypothetical protein
MCIGPPFTPPNAWSLPLMLVPKSPAMPNSTDFFFLLPRWFKLVKISVMGRPILGILLHTKCRVSVLATSRSSNDQNTKVISNSRLRTWKDVKESIMPGNDPRSHNVVNASWCEIQPTAPSLVVHIRGQSLKNRIPVYFISIHNYEVATIRG